MVGNVSSRLSSLSSGALSPSVSFDTESRAHTFSHAQVASSRSESQQWLQDVTRSNHELPCPTVGFVRYESWSADAEASFYYLQQLVATGTTCKRMTTVIPWRMSLPANMVLSFDLVADEFDPTIVSRVLRELPIWRRQSELIFLELGLLGSPAAMALAPWCNRIYLYSSEKSLSKSKTAGKLLRAWLGEGLKLNGAVQIG